MKNWYIEAKDFLENFSLDYDKLKTQLEKIIKVNFSLLGIDRDMTVSFDESKLFGKFGSVSKTNISINKTRIEMLLDLKIDDTDENHLKKVEKFYSNYDKNAKHSIFEENLYDFMKKYKEMGAEWAFSFMGSYKTVRYDILATILHEAEHIYQDEFKNCLTSKQFSNDIRSKVLIFTSLFNAIFEKLQKSGEKLNYVRENYIFPIEFDARYEELKEMSKIKNLYFKNDKNFSNHLIKSNIIPENFNAEEISAQIFADYERFYEVYNQKFGDEYKNADDYIRSNKNQIITEFVKRYNEMISISSAEKSKNSELKQTEKCRTKR